MKISKLKAISIAICCLVSSLWSEAQSIDNQIDILKSPTINRKANIQLSSQDDIDDLAFEPESPSINLEDTTTSWASYWLTPAKSALQSTYDAMKFTTQNPQKALIIAFCLTYQITATAAASCLCKTEDGNIHSFTQFCIRGGVPNATACDDYCAAFNRFLYHGCY